MADDYVCTLTEASLKVAMEELKEDPKERMSQVETFRKWILQQKHLSCPTDTRYLLKFLRTAKFSQLRAREILEGHLKLKYKYPEWFDDVDMNDPKIYEYLALGTVLPIPKRDSKGRFFVISDFGRFNPDKTKFSKNDVLRAMFGMTFYYVMKENDLVNGLVFFQDMSHFAMKNITFMGMDTMKKTTKMFEGNFPGRFKEIHYYNVGSVFETLMSVVRPLMSKKMSSRLHVHGKNMEEIYHDIPMEMFPIEYLPDDYTGPSQGSRETILANFLAELRSPEVRDRILYETSSKWKYDLKMKPEDVPSASFRKLNVD